MQTIREDGLRILSKNLPYTKHANIAVAALVGSASDPKGKEGLFHFFEHMAFQGTTNRNKDELAALFERYTFDHNAYTARLDTVYHAQTIRDHLPVVGEALFDMYQNLSFPENELAKERDVIFHEIERFWDEDFNCLNIGLAKLLYQNNHPYRVYGTGTKESVASIERDDLLHVRPRWYVPCNTVVISTGDVGHEQLVEMVNKNIPIKKETPVTQVWETQEDNVPNEKEFILERPNREKATLIVGAKLPHADERTKTMFSIFMRMMARGSDSILYKEVREKRGYAYNVQGGISGQEKFGHGAYFSVGTSPKYLGELRKLIPEMVLSHPLEENHFDRVRAGFMDFELVNMEYPKDWQNLFLDKIVDGEEDELPKIDSYREQQLEILRSITFSDVQAVRTMVRPEHLVQAILLPKK